VLDESLSSSFYRIMFFSSICVFMLVAIFASRQWMLIIHPVYTISSCSSLDSGPSYNILNLAEVADSISIIAVMHLKILTKGENLLIFFISF